MFAKILIKPDGTEEAIERKLTLEEAQELVGGYIEPVRIHDNALCLIVNEEGALFSLPLNKKATQLVHPHILHSGIRGNAIVVTRSSM